MGRLRLRRPDFIAVARRHWRFSRWLGASALLHFFADHLFVILSGALIGPVAAGAMKAAQNLMGIAQVIFFALENVVPVRAGWHFHKGGIDALVSYVKRAAKGSVAITAVIALVFCSEPEFWLRLVFGEQFAGYGILVRLYGAAYLLKAFGFAFGAGIYALENTRPIFVGYCIASTIAVAAIYPLLHAFGVTGAVIGTVMFEIVMVSVLGSAFFLRVRRLQHKSVVAPVNS